MVLPYEVALMGMVCRHFRHEDAVSAWRKVCQVITPTKWSRPLMTGLARALGSGAILKTPGGWLRVVCTVAKRCAVGDLSAGDTLDDIVTELGVYWDMAAKPEDVDEVLDLWREQAIQAEIAREIERSSAAVASGTLPALEMCGLIERAERKARAIIDSQITAEVTTADLMGEILSDYEAVINGEAGATAALDSILPELSEATGGYQIGINVIAGRPKQGKSTLAEQEVVAMARAGHECVVCTLEMLPVKFVRRVVCRMAGTTTTPLDTGNLGAFWTQFEHASHEFVGLPISVLDGTKTDRTWPAIRALIDARLDMVESQGRDVEVVAIDHFAEIVVDVGRNERKSERLGEVLCDMKAWALTRKLRVILVHQLNRGVEGASRLPTMADLREVGAMEQVMESAAFIWNAGKLNPKKIEKHSSKPGREWIQINVFTRNGPGGAVPTLWDSERAKFEPSGLVKAKEKEEDKPPRPPAEAEDDWYNNWDN